MSSLDSKFDELCMCAFKGNILEFNELFGNFLSYGVGKNYLLSRKKELTDFINVDIPYAVSNLDDDPRSSYLCESHDRYAMTEKLFMSLLSK